MADAAREPGKVIRKKRELAYEGTILKVYRDFVEAVRRSGITFITTARQRLCRCCRTDAS